MKELINIQEKLKVQKSRYNEFGRYKFRSCEDILESVKPLLKENGCELIINDELQLIGNRYYIKATATLINSEGKTVTTSAYAREDESLKGMSSAQVTGATSSYARKYALNGMFCIDDSSDPDEAQGVAQKPASKSQKPQASPAPSGDLQSATGAVMIATTVQELGAAYKQWAPTLSDADKKKLTELCSSRKKQIEANGAN